MDLRHFHTTRKNTGMMQAITRASCHWMVNMMASAPTMVTPEMKMSLRSVVGQLRDVEQVRRQAAHQLAGTVAVVVVEAQLLHVAEQVLADVRLHQDAEGVAVIADDIGEHGPQDVCAEHHRHHSEEGPVGALRQQLVHAPPGDVGKRQIDHGDHQGAAHIQEKQLPVGP